MHRPSYLSALVVLLLALAGCDAAPEVSVAAPSPVAEATPSPAPSPVYVSLIESAAVEEDALSHGGYEAVRLYKKVRLPETPGPTEVSYAVLRRDGRAVAKFDGVYHGIGNATDFGLFPFLGGETEQLFVSQTVPRGGRHWVVSLAPSFRVIYDSAAYGVGRDDFMVLDVDGDGAYELAQELTAFYGFEDMAPAETPLPEIIFKYDTRAGRYLPANHLFRDYVLGGVEKTLRPGPGDEHAYLSRRVGVVLRYIFAGQEREAWAFFEREYGRPDKEEMKRKIQAAVSRQPVYKFIYGKRAP